MKYTIWKSKGENPAYVYFNDENDMSFITQNLEKVHTFEADDKDAATTYFNQWIDRKIHENI